VQCGALKHFQQLVRRMCDSAPALPNKHRRDITYLSFLRFLLLPSRKTTPVIIGVRVGRSTRSEVQCIPSTFRFWFRCCWLVRLSLALLSLLLLADRRERAPVVERIGLGCAIAICFLLGFLRLFSFFVRILLLI